MCGPRKCIRAGLSLGAVDVADVAVGGGGDVVVGSLQARMRTRSNDSHDHPHRALQRCGCGSREIQQQSGKRRWMSLMKKQSRFCDPFHDL